MSFKFKKSNLNFRVYTSETVPDTGVENDIVIISSVPMSNWILSPDDPSGAPRTDGDVHIKYAVGGDTFNALKNDSMMIATVSAKQYISGAWVDVTARSYQNGAWVDWITYIYNEGNESTSLTGGWVGYRSSAAATLAVFEKREASIYISGPTSHSSEGSTTNLIAMDDYTTMYVQTVSVTGSAAYVSFSQTETGYVGANGGANRVTLPASTSSVVHTVDVSDLTGPWRPVLTMLNGSTVEFDKIWLE